MKAGACCWLHCEGFVQCLEPDGGESRACRAMPCDGLHRGDSCSLLCLMSLLWSGRKAEEHVLDPWHSSSMEPQLQDAVSISSPQTAFLIKLKCLGAGALGPAAGRGDSGSLGRRQSVAACYPANLALPKTHPVGQARPFTHLDRRKGNTGRAFFHRL